MKIKSVACGIVCSALLLLKPTLSLAAPMLVTLLPTGQMATQPVPGGPTRKATVAEIALWKKHSPLLSAKSPDGRYEVSKAVREDEGTTAFRIIRVRDGKIIISPKDIRHLMGQDSFSDDLLYFNGWLPRSERVSLSTNSHTSRLTW